MHVLGHGFSQRRKSSFKRPRDLHIRKVSFSGCSLSSGCSIDSSSTFTSSSTYTARRAGSTHSSSSSPPARLRDRPFISPGPDSERFSEAPATFYDDDESSDDGGFAEEQGLRRGSSDDVFAQQPKEMQLPPHAATPDHSTDDIAEPVDYFLLQFAKRPPLPRSHWSESTIQTIHTPGSILSPGTPLTHAGLDDGLDTEGSSGIGTPQIMTATAVAAQSTMTLRLGAKRRPGLATSSISAPARPPMKTVDSVENYIKRGGWKRRGIVFHKEEVDTSDDDDNNDDESSYLSE